MYESARHHPDGFFIGIDANASNLSKYSAKIYKKLARGGLSNALYVHARVEALPVELEGVADKITIHFPWGSLLSAMIQPDDAVLQGIRSLCKDNAPLEIVLGYNCEAEPTETQRLALPPLKPEWFSCMKGAYARSGFFNFQWEVIEKSQLRTLPTSWGKRLAFGKERTFYKIAACAR